MRRIQIITDSCSDLTPELLEKYGVDYARMNTVHNGDVKQADLSWTADEAHTFYEMMRNGERITTTQVPPEEFDRVFRKHLELGEDVVYISCSNRQSGSIFTAEKQAESLRKEYPDADIRCIDSLHASTGEGMIAILAAECAAKGGTMDQVESRARELIRTTHEFCTVHSLDYLKRAGRVKASAAFFGNLMGVKPVIIANTEGEQTPVTKVKGRLNSFRTVAALLKDAMSGAAEGEHGTVYIAHADCSESELEQLCELIRGELGQVEILKGYMGPIIGASVGPDAVAVFGIGGPVRDQI